MFQFLFNVFNNFDTTRFLKTSKFFGIIIFLVILVVLSLVFNNTPHWVSYEE